MPNTSWISAGEWAEFTVCGLAPREVRAPAPPKRKRPSTAGIPRKPQPSKAGRSGRLSPQQASVFIERMEAAIEAGLIDLHSDFEDCTFLDLTHGEAELLVRILYSDEPERTARLAELRDVLAKRKPRKRK